MIKQLIIENVRNVSGLETVDLSGLDVFVGPNGSGKSTRLDTVPVVVLGYNPENEGKNHESVFKDANADKMTVGLVTDAGEFRRSFENRGGSIGQTITINGDEKSKTEGNQIIAEKLGEHVILFNIADFLGLSDDKRKEFILNLGIKEDAAVIKKMILEEFLRVLSPELDGLLKYKYNKTFPELSETEINEAIKIIVNSLDGEHAQAVAEGTVGDFMRIESKNAVKYMEQVAKKYNSDLSYQRKSARELEATVKKLNELMLQKEGGSKTIAEVKKEIEDLQQQIMRVNSEIEINRKNMQIINQHESQIERVEKILEKIRSEDDPTPEIEQTAETIEKAKEYQSRMEANQTAIQKAKDKLKDVKELIEKIEGVKRVKHCILTTEIECPADLSGYLSELQNRATELEGEIEAIQSDINDIEDDVTKEFSKAALPLDVFIKGLKKRKENLESRKRENEINERAYTKELQELQSRDFAEFATVDEKTLIEQKEGIIQQKVEAERQLETLQRIKEATSEINQAELSTELAKVRIDIDKQMIAAIKTVRNRLLGKSLEPIKTLMNDLLSEINPKFKFDIFLNDSDKLVMGWPEDKQFRPFERLSKGERIIFTVAFITALYQFLNPPLKALCVKVAELDKNYFQLLLKGLKKMKQYFDNILVEYPHEVEDQDGWKVFRLGKE